MAKVKRRVEKRVLISRSLLDEIKAHLHSIPDLDIVGGGHVYSSALSDYRDRALRLTTKIHRITQRNS